MDNSAPPAAHDPRIIEDSLKEIFSQRQFSNLNPAQTSGDFSETIASFFQRLFDSPWIKSMKELLGRLTAPLLDYMSRLMKLTGGEYFTYFLVALCVIAMLIVILHIYRTLKRNVIVQEEKLPAGKAAPIKNRLALNEKNAMECASKDDFLGAMHYLYGAMLVLIDEKQLVSLNLSRTNGEIEEMVRQKGREEVQESFHQCNVMFEDVFYRKNEADPADFEDFRTRYYELKKVLC